MLTPEKIAGTSERSQQRAFLQWCALNTHKYSCLRWMYHIMNSAVVGKDPKDRAIRGAMMVADGVRKGVVDLCLPFPSSGYHGLYIEFKAPGKLKTTTIEQKEFLAFVNANGSVGVVMDSWEKARDLTVDYLENRL